MFGLGTKLLHFLTHYKFYFEMTAIGIGGITIPELIFADKLTKLLISVITLGFLIYKGVKDLRKK